MGILFSWMIFSPGSFLPQISYRCLAAQKIRLLSSVGTFTLSVQRISKVSDSSIHTRFCMVRAIPRESKPEPRLALVAGTSIRIILLPPLKIRDANAVR